MSSSRYFVQIADAARETNPWTNNEWLCNPDTVAAEKLLLVRANMDPGHCHPFHYHPNREEIIYVVEGVAEQWVDREKRTLKAGECAFIPEKVVHAIHNVSNAPMTFLAILSPAIAKGPFLIDCYDDEPWRSLRQPYRARRQRAPTQGS